MVQVELKKFCFEHVDLFDWRDDDLETYSIGSELMDALARAEERGECWTAICDGRIMVIGGIIPQTKKTAFCFTIFSRHAHLHKFAVAKVAKRLFLGMVDDMGLHRVTTFNRIGAADHHKWCEWLGFKFEGISRKFDDAGNDYRQYALVKD